MEGLEEGIGGALGGLLGGGDLARGTALTVEDLLTLEGLGVGVEPVHDSGVAERVLLHAVGTGSARGTLGTDNGLDFVRVDDAGDIRVDHLGEGKGVTGLEGGGLAEGTVELIKELKGTLGPDDETTEVTTGSELKEVEPADIDELDTGEVTEGTGQTIVLVVDNEGTTALTVTTVTKLTLTGTDLAGRGDLEDIIVGMDGLEKGNGGLGLGEGLDTVTNDKRDLGDLLDAVTTGKDQRGDSGGGEGRGRGETTLVHGNLDVPLAPGLGGGEHTTTTAHVTEGSLSGTVGTTTRDTGDTGNGPSGTPGLGGGLVTSLDGHSVGLAAVLGHGGVDLVDNIRADGSLEDGRQGDGTDGAVSGLGQDRDEGASCGSGLNGDEMREWWWWLLLLLRYESFALIPDQAQWGERLS